MIVIVNFGMGNLGSVVNMLKKIGHPSKISSELGEIAAADRLILPGVGAFDQGMNQLREMGVLPILQERVLQRKVPILGICLGMQLMTRSSEEGEQEGLGWVQGKSTKFRFEQGAAPGVERLKVPHMGWNTVEFMRPHPVFHEMSAESRFYFVHSYCVSMDDPAESIGETVHGRRFTSILARQNIVGMQFHPEKSHKFGMAILRNFIERT